MDVEINICCDGAGINQPVDKYALHTLLWLKRSGTLASGVGCREASRFLHSYSNQQEREGRLS